MIKRKITDGKKYYLTDLGMIVLKSSPIEKNIGYYYINILYFFFTNLFDNLKKIT